MKAPGLKWLQQCKRGGLVQHVLRPMVLKGVGVNSLCCQGLNEVGDLFLSGCQVTAEVDYEVQDSSLSSSGDTGLLCGEHYIIQSRWWWQRRRPGAYDDRGGVWGRLWTGER